MKTNELLIRQKLNLSRKLMLKYAHSIQLIQNRKEIDYCSMAFDCREYLKQYNIYQYCLSELKESEV